MLRENHRLGIEPATGKSQVQRPTAEPPRNTTQPPPADLRRRAIRRGYSGLTQQSQPMTTTSTKFPRRMRITRMLRMRVLRPRTSPSICLLFKNR